MNVVNSKTPSVGVIIPLYNKRDQVERAVCSAVSQSRPFDEILVIDDCSTDGSLATVSQLMEAHPSAPIRLIRHEVNRGPGAARNTGLDAFNSDYVCFLDADDHLAPDFLERILKEVTPGDGTSVLIYCIQEQSSGAVRPHVDRLRPLGQPLLSGVLKLTSWSSAMVAEPLFCSGGNVLMARELAKRTRFDETIRNFEDWDFYFRVCHTATLEGKAIGLSRVIGLTYSDEDPNSLSRARKISPHLMKVPPVVANKSLPAEVRKFTHGIWLCHVAQRAACLESLGLVYSAATRDPSVRPTVVHLAAALLSAFVGTTGWQFISHLRKRVRYV